MRAGLDALMNRPGDGRRIAVLGDMLELGDSAVTLHRELGQHAATAGVDQIFVRGDHAGDVVDGARDAGAAHAEAVNEHQAIAEAIHATAGPGDVVLVKGSRGMRMERVIEALKNLYETASKEDSCSTTSQ